MNDVLKEMGRRLTERRKQLRLSQEEVAERAELTPQTISTAETGRKALRPENIIKICAALDISPDYLLLGNITDVDISLLSEKVNRLTPSQYRHLEEIIDNFISAVAEKGAEA